MSQLLSRSDDLAKQNAARAKNGTVGKIGSKTPSTASAKLKQPNTIKAMRLIDIITPYCFLREFTMYNKKQ